MQLEVGAIVDGKVTGITNFGAFVELPEGKTGLVHISEVASTFVKEVKDYLKEGQEVKVKVLSITDGGKIGLSIKQANNDSPKGNQSDRFSRNNRFNGRQSEDRSNGRFQRRENGFQQKNPERPRTGFKGGFGESKSNQGSSSSFEDMMANFKRISDEKLSSISGGMEPPKSRARKFGKNK